MLVKDIIKANRTVLMFLHSRQLGDAYFQDVCIAASVLAYYHECGRYHPYSFNYAKQFVRQNIFNLNR